MRVVHPLAAVLGVLAIAACAGRTTTTPNPDPVEQQHAAVPLPTPPRIIPNVRLVDDTNAVPPFADTALIHWGPEPPGTVHTFPPHEYDLQNQAVHVRFDWSRHAVIGSTTLKVAALDHAISVLPLDAVGMTIKRVATTGSVPLKYDYDGAKLTVHLRRPLAAHVSTSFVIDYETVRPKRGVYFIDRNHYMWTPGAAIETRYWLPTYDHPDDKTTWQMSIVTDSNEKFHVSHGRYHG